MDYNNQDGMRELGWDDEIEDNSQSFEMVPPGDYDFTVTNFERDRYQGGAKVPPCNRAVLTLKVTSPQAEGYIKHSLLLCEKLQWRIFEFFAAIGVKRNPENGKIRMNWGAVMDAKGRCKVDIHKWVNDKGEEKESNEIKKFYPPEARSGNYVPRFERGKF